MATIDYSAFSQQVTPQELKAFRHANPRSQQGQRIVDRIQILVPAAVIAVFSIGFISALFVLLPENLFFPLQLLLASFIIGGIILVVRRLSRTKWTKWFRLYRFSQANGLTFFVDGAVPPYPGMIFSVGSGRLVNARLSRLTQSFFDIGNLSYSTGSGKNRKIHHWGYIAIKLERMLPQIILDAKSNNGFFGTNLPKSFSRSQRLSLEGDFDNYFTLYCPKEYERDALYVFTPDLMARLVDDAAGFDVELVDDWMFLYSSKRIKLDEVATLQHVFNVIDTVGTKTLSRTERYADSKMVGEISGEHGLAALSSRMDVNTVSHRGRRLKSKIPILTLITVVGVVAVWLFTFAPLYFRF